MLCAVCGSENPDMGGYCFSCGKPLGGASLVIGGSAAAVPAVHPQELNDSNGAPDQRQNDPEVERIRTQYPGLVGVGGWLGWFCIVITVISPAIVLVGTILGAVSILSHRCRSCRILDLHRRQYMEGVVASIEADKDSVDHPAQSWSVAGLVSTVLESSSATSSHEFEFGSHWRENACRLCDLVFVLQEIETRESDIWG